MQKCKNLLQCVRIIVHNCRTQHSIEQFWLPSLLSSRQAPELRCCLLEGTGVSRQWRNSKQWTDPVAWRHHHPFFAQHWTPEGRGAAPYILALW